MLEDKSKTGAEIFDIMDNLFFILMHYCMYTLQYDCLPPCQSEWYCHPVVNSPCYRAYQQGINHSVKNVNNRWYQQITVLKRCFRKLLYSSRQTTRSRLGCLVWFLLFWYDLMTIRYQSCFACNLSWSFELCHDGETLVTTVYPLICLPTLQICNDNKPFKGGGSLHWDFTICNCMPH